MNTVSISSGGSRGIYALGAAWELQKQGYFDAATTYAGTSIGAVIAAGLVLGRSPIAMLRTVIKYPLQHDLSMSGTDFGLDTGKGLRTFIRRILGVRPGRRRMSLKDVYRTTGKTLRICVCNVTDCVPEYWTHATHPDVDLVTALRISCSVPVIFKSVRYKGKVYVDGAIVDPLPIVDPDRTLAIAFDNTRSGSLETMGDFIGALRTANRPVVTSRHVITLRCDDVDEFDFAVPPPILKRCFASGKKQASDWIKKNV
jgi:predicted acylesterase/phospholipase RssA